MTRFMTQIDVTVEGDIVHAKLFDRQNVQEIACTRQTAVRAAMSLLNQLTPDDGATEADVIPMLRKAAGG